ncbi:glucose-6-phosphate dehydrogenase assembly protein OpcA [Corynebacterium tapiri]|uniref:Oxppcycle protein OpcA n=1 Tax=Corynebacterium tapiri TaxID=1448266 RepID=A0A5C4U3B8_9CORY|nr:glucose-6-phosphate dehydrogenase assembly protein OpcA [Corynebacterium tapiri]TNL97568.1 oxppcycle protein OpcA [Corynebacterium tapiri]
MIVNLPDTTTRKISKTLLDTQEDYSMATGRVLTLIVVADASDDVEAILAPIRNASHEHPSRVLVLLKGERQADSRLDARLLFGGDSGASETIIMTLSGEMAEHAASVVTPLLLPDTPIVAWWPCQAPAVPADHQIGRIAQRRITNSRNSSDANTLVRLADGYRDGDSDLAWSRITGWRGLVASALDRLPREDYSSVVVSGPAEAPTVDIAAGWLAARIDAPVVRETCEGSELSQFPIQKLVIESADGDLVVEAVDDRTVRVSIPDSADSLVALTEHSDADSLAEELRHLGPDSAYAESLSALKLVTAR